MIALEITDDLATVVLFIFAIIFAVDALRVRSAERFLPLIWFLALFAVAPVNGSAWRFSYEALVPLTLMAGVAISSIVPKPSLTKKRRGFNRHRSKRSVAIFISLSLVLIFVGSWGQRTIENATSPDASAQAQAQQQVYSAIYWLRDNTPRNSTYLSVSDWRFTFTGLMIGRETEYIFRIQPNGTVQFARSSGCSYIFVTNLVTENLAQEAKLFRWNNFKPSSDLSLVYNSTDVRVFRVV